MAEYIKLDKPVVHGMEVKMRSNGVLLAFVGRILYRRKVEYLISLRHYNYAARVLAGGALDPGAAGNEPFRFGPCKKCVVLLAISLYIAIYRFILKAGYRACAEGVALAVHDLRIGMRLRLIVAGKV